MQQIPISEDWRLQSCLGPVERDLDMLTACIKACIGKPVSMPEEAVHILVHLVDTTRRSTQRAKRRIAEAKGYVLLADTPEEWSSLDATDEPRVTA